MPTDEICSIEDCENQARTRGWCPKHYRRWQMHGDPTVVLNNRGIPAAERFRASYRVEEETGCWLWQRSLIGDGYGTFWADGTTHMAHRWGYELLVGPIPDGLHIDHLCRTRNCVNPGHLEPVTPAENALRGAGPLAVNARKIECHRGHLFDEANTLVRRSGRRRCKTCARERRREINAARRAEIRR
jgi:hypothetical protein